MLLKLLVITQALCAALDIPNAIAFDMGGTTAKAGVVRHHQALVANSVMIGGYQSGLPLLTPMIDIHEVGTGGGSLASLSSTGALRVGPQSAGASPGPACYGLGGTAPTVTDANVLLGRLDPKHFLGGEMQLDLAAADRAMRTDIAKPLGMNSTEAASGILRIAAAAMSHAVRGVTTDRGLDTGAFPTMFAYGGAGPLHASMVARELRMPHVVIPRAPGHFSAFGMLLADFRRDLVRSHFITLAELSLPQLEQWFSDLEAQGLQTLEEADVGERRIMLRRHLDMRYIGQEHAVTVEIPASAFRRKSLAGIKAVFDEAHRERYGRGSPEEPAEIVSLRSTIIGVLKKPVLEKIAIGTRVPPAAAKRGQRQVYFEPQGWLPTPVYAREALRANNRLVGPALIEEHASTTVVQPGDRLHVDAYGNLHIAIALGASSS
jgi:N-methylhydantoinase A